MKRILLILSAVAVLSLWAFAEFSSECTYSFWYVTTPNEFRPGSCWILTSKWYVPKRRVAQ